MAIRMRFNLLHLEEGEHLFDEYGAVVYAWTPPQPGDGGAFKPLMSQRGRVRICSRCVSFEPDDVNEPIAKWPLRSIAGKPALLSAAASVVFGEASASLAADGLHPRDAISFQPTTVVELKAGNVIGPYRTRQLDVGPTAPTSTAEEVRTPGKSSGAAAQQLQQPSSPASGAGGKLLHMFGKKSGAATPPPAVAVTAEKRAPSGEHSRGRFTVVLAMPHTPAAEVLPLLSRLWTIQQLAAGAHSGYERAALDPVLAGRADGSFDLSLLGNFLERPLTPAAPFSIPVERVFPLVSCPGRLLITEKAVYIQPVSLNNIAGSDPVSKWHLRDIRRVLRRRRLLREVGLELLLQGDAAWSGVDGITAGLRPNSTAAGSSGSVFLVFRSPTTRDEVYRVLLTAIRESRGGGAGGGSGSSRIRRGAAGGSSSPHTRIANGSTSSSSASSGSPQSSSTPDAAAAAAAEAEAALGDPTPGTVASLTRAWHAGALSNYEYLEALNSAAGRTAADLTQYPVMPWVLSDYSSPTLDLNNPASFRDLSKPIGALNEKRLASVRARYADMPAIAAAESTAASSASPGGSDEPAPDPPFMYGTHYSTPGYCLHFLVRAMPEHMLHLQSGRFDAPDRLFFDMATSWAGVTSVNMDVKELVPEFYASDGSFLLIPEGLDLGVRQNGRRVGDVGLPPWAYDAGDFVAQCRAALESEYVSAHLHEWIDLIFGYKQRGPAAVSADNVFYHLTYEGAVDIEAVTDPDRRSALQSQIAEFGQTPRQLFVAEHPARCSSSGGVASLMHATHRLSIEGGGEGAAEDEDHRSSSSSLIIAAVDAAAASHRDRPPSGSSSSSSSSSAVGPSSSSSSSTSSKLDESATRRPTGSRSSSLDDDGIAAILRSISGNAAAAVADSKEASEVDAQIESHEWVLVPLTFLSLPSSSSSGSSSPTRGAHDVRLMHHLQSLDHSAAVSSLLLRARARPVDTPTMAVSASFSLPPPSDVVSASVHIVSAGLDGFIRVTELFVSWSAASAASTIIPVVEDGGGNSGAIAAMTTTTTTAVSATLVSSVSIVPAPIPRVPFSVLLHPAVVVHSVVYESVFAGLPVSSLAALKDSTGRRICYAAGWDGCVRLVDLRQGVVAATLSVEDATIDAASISNSGPRSPCACVCVVDAAAAPAATAVSELGAAVAAAMLVAPSRGASMSGPSGGPATAASSSHATHVVLAGRWDGAVSAWRVGSRIAASGEVALVGRASHCSWESSSDSNSSNGGGGRASNASAVVAIDACIPRSTASSRAIAAAVGTAGCVLLCQRATVAIAVGASSGRVTMLLLTPGKQLQQDSTISSSVPRSAVPCSEADGDSMYQAAAWTQSLCGVGEAVDAASLHINSAIVGVSWGPDWGSRPQMMVFTRDGRIASISVESALPSASGTEPYPFRLVPQTIVVTGQPTMSCLRLPVSSASTAYRAATGCASGRISVWDTKRVVCEKVTQVQNVNETSGPTAMLLKPLKWVPWSDANSAAIEGAAPPPTLTALAACTLSGSAAPPRVSLLCTGNSSGTVRLWITIPVAPQRPVLD